MTIPELYQLYLQHHSVQTDTRQLKHNDIFFALSGPNFNGNQFALQALETDAAYAIVDKELSLNDKRVIKVDDVLTTLQSLARHHRQQFNIPFIAITGSNGKTTTKELVNAVLASTYITYTTRGNLNNHIGIPLTLLRVQADAEMAVIEMGANHLKEIEEYCKYVLPTHGIITNCGKAHLEGFGSMEGVKKGKGELFDFLRTNNGTAFIYDDYDYLRNMSSGIKNVVTYGTGNAFLSGEAVPGQSFLKVQITNGIEGGIINTNLVGDYNLPNVLCAAAVGKFFNVPAEKIKQSLESYTPSNSRSQLIERGTNKIILDAYNANPSSMQAAIENISKIDSHSKVLLLGGMMELGENSLSEHQKIINLLGNFTWHKVALVGGDFSKLTHQYNYFENAAEAGKWLKQQALNGAYILVKGSRSMKMEKILDDIT